MSEQIQTPTPDSTRQGENQQAAWLDLARRQAHTAADIRIQGVEPFDWEDVERRPATGWWRGLLWGPAAPSRLRLSWALPALAVVVLGGATGTLAYVHLKEDVSIQGGQDTQLLDEGLRPAGTGKVRGKKKHLRGPAPIRPAPAPEKKRERVKRPVRKSTRKSPARRKRAVASKKTKKTLAAKPVTKPEFTPGKDIVFGNTDMPGGGDVIIVRPPAKLGPLFRTKDFKKGGPYGSRR